MLAVPEEIKELFRKDNLGGEETRRKWKLRFFDSEIQFLFPEDTLFPSDDLFPADQEPIYTIENIQMVTESVNLTESLCESENLVFGECNAAQFGVTVADVLLDLTGKEFMVTVEVGDYEMSMGIYTVDSFVRQADKRLKKIIAYDRMRKFHIDVSAWYQELVFPMTLKQFRKSLCDYVGVIQLETELPLDEMAISKTIEPEQLSGLDVLRAICEINGCFGHMDKTGRLGYKFLPISGLYPSEILFPDDDLYPSEMSEDESETLYHYKQSETSYEDFIVAPIERLQIRQEEGDIGIRYGNAGNTYVIQGNFLAYGKSSDELLNIASTIYENISGRIYRPCKIMTTALPWVEVGDGLTCYTTDDVVETYCMKRTLKGIQGMMDTYEATGSIKLEENFGIQTQIMQLEGKTAVIKKSVEEVSVSVTDLKNYTDAKLKVTAEEISAEVNRAKDAEEKLSASIKITAQQIASTVTDLRNETNTKFEQTAQQIALRVTAGEVTSLIEQNANSIRLQATEISWQSKYSSMTADGKLNAVDGIFSGKINGGSIDIGNGNFTVDANGKVVARDITVGTTSSRSVIYGSTVLASKMTVNDSFSVDCYANMADIGANTISCGKIYANNLKDDCYTFSDLRLKQDIQEMPLGDAKYILQELHPVIFTFKKDGARSMGVIAQDVVRIMERGKMNYPLFKVDEDGWYTVPYKNFLPIMIRVLQEQQRDIESLKQWRKGES